MRKNSLIHFAANSVAYFFQFLTTIVVSRILLPEEIGVFAVSMAAVAILQGLREFGVVSYIIKETDLTDAKIRTVFSVAIVIGVVCAGSLFFGRHWIGQFFGSPQMSSILLVLSLSFLVYPFGQPATGMLRRERRFVQLAVVIIGASAAGFIVTCSFTLFGHGAIALAYGTLANSLLLGAISLYFWPLHLKMKPSLVAWRDVLSYGMKASLVTLISKAGMASPELFVGKAFGMHETALLTRGRALTYLIERIAVAPIVAAATPELAHQIRQNKKLSGSVIKVSQMVTLLTWPILTFLAYNSDVILEILYGKIWVAASIFMKILCLSQAVLSTSVSPLLTLDASGRMDTILRVEVSTKIVLFSMLFFGSMGSTLIICWAMVAYASVRSFVYWWSVGQWFEIGLAALLRSHGLPLAVTSAVFLSQIGVHYLIEGAVYSGSLRYQLFAITINALMTVVVALVALRIASPPTFSSLLGMLKSVLRIQAHKK